MNKGRISRYTVWCIALVSDHKANHPDTYTQNSKSSIYVCGILSYTVNTILSMIMESFYCATVCLKLFILRFIMRRVLRTDSVFRARILSFHVKFFRLAYTNGIFFCMSNLFLFFATVIIYYYTCGEINFEF